MTTPSPAARRSPLPIRLAQRALRAALWRFSYVYGRFLLWRFVDGVYVRGLHRTRALLDDGPIILAANHTSWWDGIWTLMVQHWLGADGRFLVAQASHETTGVIQTYGGIGVDPSNLKDLSRAMEEAAAHLDGPGRTVLLFPQGRFRAPGIRPLALKRGVGLLQRWSKAPVVPLSITMAFLDNHLPAAILTFGEPIAPRRDLVPVLEAQLTADLADQEAWVDDLSRPPDFEQLVGSAVVPIERRPGALVWTGLLEVLSWPGRLLRPRTRDDA